VGVSRDCFPIELTKARLGRLTSALLEKGVKAWKCPVVVENETDIAEVMEHLGRNKVNAVVIYLGNFGPEAPASMLAARLDCPVMVCAAAEESRAGLKSGRGDALCGLLSCSYNLGLRRVRVHIPAAPVGTPGKLAAEIAHFADVARVVLGVRGLKIVGFGPRPADFFACNAPIQPLMDLGVEIAENSELDLFQAYRRAAGRRSDVRRVARDMERELGPEGNTYPDLIEKLAQYEVALTGLIREQAGASRYAAVASKCWPAFEHEFGFVPCYVNGRLAGRGIPIACEADFYGALSEYVLQAASLAPATLLDVNNSVPGDMVEEEAMPAGVTPEDLFMGFHCGNTFSGCMKNCKLNYQVIMNRLMEAGGPPDITRGTLEGQIRPGPATMFRLQGGTDNTVRCCIAEGEFLDVDPATFGATGIVAIPGFARFYRHVLVSHRFPHHSAFGFKKAGRVVFDAMKLIGVEDVHVPLPDGQSYPGENPFQQGDR
jgi:L-fucose isomerase-like protein